LNTQLNQYPECPICLDELIQNIVTTVPCEHDFHEVCLSDARKLSTECPMCRTEVTNSEPVIRIQNVGNEILINNFIEASSRLILINVKKMTGQSYQIEINSNKK